MIIRYLLIDVSNAFFYLSYYFIVKGIHNQYFETITIRRAFSHMSNHYQGFFFLIDKA